MTLNGLSWVLRNVEFEPSRDPAGLCALVQLLSSLEGMAWWIRDRSSLLSSLQPDSEVAEAGRCLEVFFEGWLKEIYPRETAPLSHSRRTQSFE